VKLTRSTRCVPPVVHA